MFLSVTGVIREMQMVSANRSRYGGCSQMITVEEAGGGITNFFVNRDTYVVDFATLSEGMQVTVFYNGNLPAPLIYPPQFIAAVVAPRVADQMVTVAFFNQMLVAADQSLRLNPGPNTEIVTSNNQIFRGSPGGHTLVVLYRNTTRSIPPQTTPDRIIVLCGI